MLTIKNNTMLLPPFIEGLNQIYNSDQVSVSTSLKVMKLAKAIDQEIKTIREAAQKILENEEKIKELLDIETTLDFQKIPLSKIENVNLSAGKLDFLSDIIDFES